MDIILICSSKLNYKRTKKQITFWWGSCLHSSLYWQSRMWDFPGKPRGCSWSLQGALCGRGQEKMEGDELPRHLGEWQNQAQGAAVTTALPGRSLHSQALCSSMGTTEVAWYGNYLHRQVLETSHHRIVLKESDSYHLSNKPQSSLIPKLPPLTQINVGAPIPRQGLGPPEARLGECILHAQTSNL